MYVIKKIGYLKYWTFDGDDLWSPDINESYTFISYSMAEEKAKTLSDTIVVFKNKTL